MTMRVLLLFCCVLIGCRRDEVPPPIPEVAPVEAEQRSQPAAPVEETKVGGEAEAAGAPEDTACEMEGFVADPDPAGLNVRADASSHAPVMAKIALDPDGTVVEVVDSRNGWLRLRRVKPMNDDPWPVDGWVSGRMIETAIRCPDENPGPDCMAALRAAPSPSAEEVKRLAVDTRVRIVGCRNGWVEAETAESDRSRRSRGWLEPDAQCPNPVTTCP